MQGTSWDQFVKEVTMIMENGRAVYSPKTIHAGNTNKVQRINYKNELSCSQAPFPPP